MAFQLAEPLNPSETGLVLLLELLLLLLLFKRTLLRHQKLLLGLLFCECHLIQVDASPGDSLRTIRRYHLTLQHSTHDVRRHAVVLIRYHLPWWKRTSHTAHRIINHLVHLRLLLLLLQ